MPTGRMIITPEQRRAAATAAAIAGVATLLPALTLILLGHNTGRAAWDSIVYHEPFIRQLAADWPRFDLSNPLTATTPGYHLLLATLVAVGLDGETPLRLASALIGTALAAAIAAWCAKRTRPLDAVLLTLPLACSVYTLGSSAWLLPDNLAWIGVAGLLMLALHETRSWRPVIASSVVLIALVFTRQIHLWSAGLVWLAAWFSARPAGTPAFVQIPQRLPRVVVAVMLTLPSFLIVAWFFQHWSGLTPPRFRSDITGMNPATPAFILVQIAILSLGFGPWLLPALLQTARHRPAVLAVAVVIAVLLSVIPTTTHDPDSGRYSGWWTLVRATPTIASHTSVLFLVFAPLGSVILAGALTCLPSRSRWVMLGALIAFATAQGATINAWQRYHEPFLILFLAMLAGLQPPELRSTPLARLRLPAMAALSLMLAAIAAQALRGEPIPRGTLPPQKHTSPHDPWSQPWIRPKTDPNEQTPAPPVEGDLGQAQAQPGR